MENNQYSYTKAIRFRAIPQNNVDQLKVSKAQDKDELMHQFIKNADSFIDGCFKWLMTNYGGYKPSISVHKDWLTLYYKQEFHESIKNTKQRGNFYELPTIARKLNDFIREHLGYLKKCIDCLRSYNNTSLHSQNRRSEFAELIKVLSSAKGLEYVVRFLDLSKDKYDDTTLNDLKEQAEGIKEVLEQLEQSFLPKQTAGIEVAKASMNYYTVNKKPKNYESALEKQKSRLNEKKYIIKKEKKGYALKNSNGQELFTFQSKQEQEWLRVYLFGITGQLQGEIRQSIKEVYELIKAFKSEQKAIFFEIIKKIANGDQSPYQVQNKTFVLGNIEYEFPYSDFKDRNSLNKTFLLFQFKKDQGLDTFIAFEKRINQLVAKNTSGGHARKNKQDQITKLKNEKGKWLFGKDCYFQKYGNFCEGFKNIAGELGKIKARIKGIEKERLEAQNTQYWSVIYEEGGDKFLWLVPKETADLPKAFKFLSNPERKKETDPIGHYYLLSSITMRALSKLCFSEEGSFVKEMPHDLLDEFKQVKELKTGGDEDKMKQKRSKKLAYLKAVLTSEYAKKQLNLRAFDLKASLEARSLDDFEMALEKASYQLPKIPLSERAKNHFMEEFKVVSFKISSYDLDGRNKYSELRTHTTHWNDFWDLNKDIRLNPEFKIRYRQADEVLKKYLDEKSFRVQKHRKLHDQFTVNFTLTLNAGKKHPELAFMKTDELRKKINDYNESFNKQNFDGQWKYGIDRGNIELATLCLTKFNKNEIYEHKDKTFLKPTFPNGDRDIKCYELEKEYYNHEDYRSEHERSIGKKRRIIDNLSYFVEKKDFFEGNWEDWFEEKTVTCIDLTTAKVIKGKIILNADVNTYLRLKKENAKRKLYDLFNAGKIGTKDDLHWIEEAQGLLVVNTIGNKAEFGKLEDHEKSKNQLYFFSSKYEKLLSKEQIQQNLAFYLSELRKDIREPYNNEHTPTISKINHLRDAITANMIGVIFHLQKEYPGIVILEDLNQSLLDKHFNAHNENISRRLEWALYKKFQTLGKVPPHLKDIIKLRESVRRETRKKPFQLETPKRSNNAVRRETRKKSFQLGAIVFVDESGTSKNCPKCEQKQAPKNDLTDEEKKKRTAEFKRQKFDDHRFLCADIDPCGFDTQELQKTDMLSEINDPDKVAAYNVAKKIKSPDDIAKIPEIQKKESNDSPKNNNLSQYNKKQAHKNSPFGRLGDMLKK